MRKERKKRTCIEKERAINKIGLIISQFRKALGLIISNNST
jgi:hypothetical protein